MGFALLGDVLKDWSRYELDDSIYVHPHNELTASAQVNILAFDPLRKRLFEGQVYFLGIEQIRDVVEGLEAQLGRTASVEERLRAVAHYAKHDAFISPAEATKLCLRRIRR